MQALRCPGISGDDVQLELHHQRLPRRAVVLSLATSVAPATSFVPVEIRRVS